MTGIPNTPPNFTADPEPELSAPVWDAWAVRELARREQRINELEHARTPQRTAPPPGKTPPPKWADLWGIDPNITGGLSITDYLATSRGEHPSRDGQADPEQVQP